MKELIKNILKHWKTSLGGFIVSTAFILWIFGKLSGNEWITTDELTGLTVAIVGAGLFWAKDFDKVKEHDDA